ncbi:MAG: helicase-related protein [Bryobacteraceae bacterium]
MPETNDGRRSVRPDVERILSGLKPFQRRSVDYVFDRLYGADSTRRFLLADEVGLGKTLVAKGVIARAIDWLWEETDRIDIVYICSNHDIARQNINRLNITGQKDFALASRITLLPIMGGGDHLRKRKLNFVSFTPGTSFDLKSTMGISTERVLLYHLLAGPWDLSGAGPRNVLQGECLPENFRWQLDHFSKDYTIDPGMADLFLAHVKEDRELKNRFFALCKDYHRADANVPPDISRRRSDLIGELRETLAGACLNALEPDLIILDEFQRFKHLLVDNPDSAASQLAHDLFQYSNEHTQARVLMLSATPYKMYTMGHELADDDHYADFLETVRFLFADGAKTEALESLLKEYRRLLYRLGQDDSSQILAVRQDLERCLRGVMCRTERLSVTADRCGMLEEKVSTAELESADLESYVALQSVARVLDHPDTIEYWKSSPYLLSFMEHYSLKQNLRDRAHEPDVVAAFKAAEQCPGVLLPWASLRSFKSIDPRNSRLRELIHDTVDCGAWQALWMPPSLPYYNLAGVFADLTMKGFTKRLVFSSWQVVPKTIATLVSYEVERRMITSQEPEAQNTPQARKARRPLLNFATSNSRLTGMPILGLLYPSYFLAQQFDPLRYMCEQPAGSRLDAGEVLSLIESDVSKALDGLVQNAPDFGPEDEAWYWAAPILLDARADPKAAQEWWANKSLAIDWLGSHEDGEADQDGDGDALGGSEGWRKHVTEASQMLADPHDKLGRPPKDLAEVVAQLALAGPAVTALRAIARITGGIDGAMDPFRRHMAGKIAFGFRALFNASDVIALIRGQNSAEPYWRRVLDYCVAGCLQAVLDEYVHVLRESLGDADAEPSQIATDVGGEIAAVLNLRVATPGADEISVDVGSGLLTFENQGLRAWFAMRFGDEKDAEGRVSRADQVRKAFNSPFRPFVLATTSVGQEGLDFHTYCHAVMHWNLPSNPVDMEQREGRIHRYKGHAVRRNVAKRHGAELANNHQDDPWSRLFEIARNASIDASGLTPFWVYTAEGGATIERHVPVLPLSREADQLPSLRNSLAVYRMVFGQPRQDDLVEFLLRQLARETLASLLDQLRMDLAPREVRPQPTRSKAIPPSPSLALISGGD